MNSQTVANAGSENNFTSWLDLVEKGDGYLTPYQRQTFEKAFAMLSRQMDKALSSKSVDLDNLEELFYKTAGEAELDQDAALTAYRVLNYLIKEMSSGAH